MEHAKVLGNFSALVDITSIALRKHVGTPGLVVWMTSNDICDDKYQGSYAKNVAMLRAGREDDSKGKTDLKTNRNAPGVAH